MELEELKLALVSDLDDLFEIMKQLSDVGQAEVMSYATGLLLGEEQNPRIQVSLHGRQDPLRLND